MIAMFLVVEQGWTKEDAIQEMVNGGYGFHRLWFGILGYVKHAEVEKIRKQLEKCPPFTTVRYGILNQFVGSFHADLVYSFPSDWAPD